MKPKKFLYIDAAVFRLAHWPQCGGKNYNIVLRRIFISLFDLRTDFYHPHVTGVHEENVNLLTSE